MTKIKIEADISSIESSLNNLKSSVSQLSDKLKTASGRADVAAAGPNKQLQALIAQADKLTKAMDAADKKSASYAKNLQAAAKALQDASRVSSRVESLGNGSSRTSGYFNQYSSELAGESSSANTERILQRERERAQNRMDAERSASGSRWARGASRFAGFVGGSIMGGGSGYANLGAGIGSMLPGPWGMVASGVGGLIGGFADKTIGASKDENRDYSLLRRSIGGITSDFDNLRSTVRATVTGFGIANVEAANLAKNFAKTANLTSDVNGDISRSIGTAAGMAQGYGMDPSKSTEFLATMRINGVGKNDLDNKRLALQIGEAVARSGTTAKMDETLGAITGFVARSASQTMTTPLHCQSGFKHHITVNACTPRLLPEEWQV